MATSREVIELLFNAEYKGTAEVRALKRDLQGLSEDFGAGVSTAAAFTAALSAIELAAISASIGLAKAGVDAAGKFNGQFAEITTLISATDAELETFKNGIQDYASTSTASISDINAALYNAISAGVDYKDSIEFLAVAEKLSVAGKTDLNSAVQVLTATLSAYGEETSQAGKYSDILFTTVKNGVTTVPELVASLGQITGTAAALGVSFEEVSAATATMTKNGIATSQSMTVLKAIISNIIKPNKDAKDTANALGISLGTSALQAKGLAGVIEEMAVKTGGSKEKMASLFGSVEALNGALILTSEKGFKTFQSDLAAMNESAGATDGAVGKMTKNIELIKQTLANNIEGTLIALGTPLLDEFADIQKAITAIFSTIRQNITEEDGALVPVLDAVERLAQTVTEIISGMAANMDQALSTANLSGFTGAFDAINDALKGLNLESPEGLARAIESIGRAFEGITRFTISVTEVFAGMVDVFGEIAALITDLDPDFWSLAGSVGGFALAISTAVAVLSPFYTLLKGFYAIGGIAGALGSASKLGALQTSVDAITSGVGKLGVAGAALAGGFVAGGAAVELLEEKTGILEKTFTDTSGVAGPALIEMLEKFSKETGNTNATMADLAEHLKNKNQLIADGTDILEKDRQEANRWFEAHKDGRTTITTSKEDIERWKEAQKAAGIVTGETALTVEQQAKKLQALSQSTQASANGVKKLGDTAQATKKQLESWRFLDSVFDFKTAEVQAKSKEIESIMNALGGSGKAAGEALAGAFGTISSGEFAGLDVFQQDSVQKSIEKMSESQQVLAKAQADMAAAKAEYMKAQTSAVMNGDALITIDGTNLEPQLEAFMFEILKSIQMRVSAEYADFLLGLPAK